MWEENVHNNTRNGCFRLSAVALRKVTKLVSPFTSLCLAQVSRTNNMAASGKIDMKTMDGNKMQDANEFLCPFMDKGEH